MPTFRLTGPQGQEKNYDLKIMNLFLIWMPINSQTKYSKVLATLARIKISVTDAILQES